MKRWIYTGAAMAALIVTGLVHGFWTDRWIHDRNLTEAAARLDAIPMQIGEWEGADMEVKSKVAVPGVVGSVQRTYRNRRLGATVVLSMVNGRPGPVATHTPEACYGASGYLVGQRKEVHLDTRGGPAQFWTADATRTRVTEETKLRIFWAWNGGEGWTASKEARGQFPRFRYPVLHKLYILRDLNDATAVKPGAGTSAKDEPCVAFLEDLVPVLDQQLFAAGE